MNALQLRPPREEVESATDRTTLWAQGMSLLLEGKKLRSRWKITFGIVQGGGFEDLRIKSAEELMTFDFPGYAIGGVSVGETEEEMLEQVSWVSSVLPREKPRYVMGVGTPASITANDRDGC